MRTEQFGRTKDGTAVDAYILERGAVRAVILGRGGVLQSLTVNGTDVVLGYDTVEGYEVSGGYLGAVVGRYANRIRGGTFEMDGKAYRLACNENGKTHLHGGMCGFDSRIFTAEDASDARYDAVRLYLVSPDGEEGYPGKLVLGVTYSVDETGLSIRYQAEANAKTPFNPTNHAYFNCNGGGTVTGHTLQVNADTYAPVDEMLIPLTTAAPVDGTAFDFRAGQTIGAALARAEAQYERTGGVDHNFNLCGGETCEHDGKMLARAAVLRGERLTMTLDTDFPCIQVYTANFLNGSYPLKGGVSQAPRAAVCLETQMAAADGPNRGEAFLEPGEAFDRMAYFKFS